MSRLHTPSRSAVIVSALCLALVGCAVPELPENLDVAISSTDSESAPRDSGPMAAANNSWKAFRKADDSGNTKQALPGPYGGLLDGGILERPPVDGQIFVVDFGDDGAMTGIHENKYFLPEVYGSDVPVGGEWSPSTVPFVRFRSASYGTSLDDRFGMAVIVHVKFVDIYIGRAVIYAWGTIADDRIDGTLGYLLDFTGGIGGFAFNAGGDQYPFYAERVP